MILVQAFRLHVVGAPDRGDAGLLFALADPQVRRALEAIHGDPVHPWTVATLAARAGGSRSGFARRFRARVGEDPMSYVTRWRMLLAADRLAASKEPVSAVARSVGYQADSAFSTAFHRIMGHSPRRYARWLAMSSAAGRPES